MSLHIGWGREILMQITGLLSHHAIRPYSMLHQFTPGPKWYIFEGNLDTNKDLDEYVTALSQFLSDAKKFIHVVGGELCSKVWNHPNVINALMTSKAKDINFICGPMFDIRNIDLIRLVKTKKIQLWYVSERQKEHFRVTDNGVFIEGYHNSFLPERNAIFCKNSEIISTAYDNKVNQLKISGNIKRVEPDEVLEVFSIKVYDSKVEDKCRSPNDGEKKAVLQILRE